MLEVRTLRYLLSHSLYRVQHNTNVGTLKCVPVHRVFDGLTNEIFGVKIPARAEILVQISAPLAPLPSQLSYEYTNRTPSVRR